MYHAKSVSRSDGKRRRKKWVAERTRAVLVTFSNKVIKRGVWPYQTLSDVTYVVRYHRDTLITLAWARLFITILR